MAIGIVAVAGTAALDSAFVRRAAEPAPERNGSRRFVAFGPLLANLIARELTLGFGQHSLQQFPVGAKAFVFLSSARQVVASVGPFDNPLAGGYCEARHMPDE